jgi:DNA invertase Pin-like site-specific DNA recombinase
MIYGYARVSTDAQDLAIQLDTLKAAGCEKVFHDKEGGDSAERPQLKRLMKKLSAGDIVKAPATDRFARDPTDLLVLGRDIRAKGARFVSIAEPIVDTESEFWELVAACFGIAAKFELRRIRERTSAGRAAAKAQGVKFGRKPKLTPHQIREALQRRDVDDEPHRSIARSYNVSQSTISRLRPPGAM